MACVDHFLYVTFIIISTFVIFSCFHIELKENVSGLMGGGGGQRVCCPPPPSQIIGGGGGLGVSTLDGRNGSCEFCCPWKSQKLLPFAKAA